MSGQASIFDGGIGEAEPSVERHHPVISSAEFDERELLRLEKETLGLYVSEHPLERVRTELRRKTDCALSDLERQAFERHVGGCSECRTVRRRARAALPHLERQDPADRRPRPQDLSGAVSCASAGCSC